MHDVTRDDARAAAPGDGDESGDLAVALDAGRVGTWTWDIASGRTVWDARLEELHGMAPGTFGGTVDDWYAALHPDDRDECLARVERALADRSPYVLLHRAIRGDGSVRWIESRGAVVVDDRDEPVRTTGIAFDITIHKLQEDDDAAEIAREQRLVDMLQLALLPADPPEVAGITVATRYVSAQGPGEVGGDWYSLVPLDRMRLGVAIGDVAGHGLGAVADMAAARFGLRALAVTNPEPARVLELMDEHVRLFERDTMITSLYGILDPATRTWTYANAGHCTPLVRQCDGEVVALGPATEPPLGFGVGYHARTFELSPRATVVLYTDGLIERRGEDISIGTQRLVDACRTGPQEAEELCDHLLDRLLRDAPNADDVAVVVITLD